MAEARNGGVKTLGIKVPDALHAQFALVAQLDGISLEMRPCGPSSCTSPPRRLSPTLLRELRPRSKPLSRRRRHGEGRYRGCLGQSRQLTLLPHLAVRRPEPLARRSVGVGAVVSSPVEDC